MTIPFIGKVKIDGVETYIDANSCTYEAGLPTIQLNVLVNGSATKTTPQPDFTNARSSVSFSIRINADSGKVNPTNLFKSLKSKYDTEIQLLPEDGSGGMIFRKMVLTNDISSGISPDSTINFAFQGDSAIILES